MNDENKLNDIQTERVVLKEKDAPEYNYLTGIQIVGLTRYPIIIQYKVKKKRITKHICAKVCKC